MRFVYGLIEILWVFCDIDILTGINSGFELRSVVDVIGSALNFNILTHEK